jgi:hypothetical protein
MANIVRTGATVLSTKCITCRVIHKGKTTSKREDSNPYNCFKYFIYDTSSMYCALLAATTYAPNPMLHGSCLGNQHPTHGGYGLVDKAHNAMNIAHKGKLTPALLHAYLIQLPNKYSLILFSSFQTHRKPSSRQHGCRCFEPPTSKFVLRVWPGWCAKRTQGFILVQVECPMSSRCCSCH